jgi:hypothetical protein
MAGAACSRSSGSLLELDDDDDDDEQDCEVETPRFIEFGASRNDRRDTCPGDGTALSFGAGRSTDPVLEALRVSFCFLPLDESGCFAFFFFSVPLSFSFSLSVFFFVMIHSSVVSAHSQSAQCNIKFV